MDFAQIARKHALRQRRRFAASPQADTMPKKKVLNDGSTVEEAENTLSNQLLGQIGLSSFIISTFFPQIAKWLAAHPKLVRWLSAPLAMWFGYEFLIGKLTGAWYSE
jgi:hypothetical protein